MVILIAETLVHGNMALFMMLALHSEKSLKWNTLLSHKDGKTYMVQLKLKLMLMLKNQSVMLRWILTCTISPLIIYHH